MGTRRVHELLNKKYQDETQHCAPLLVSAKEGHVEICDLLIYEYRVDIETEGVYSSNVHYNISEIVIYGVSISSIWYFAHALEKSSWIEDSLMSCIVSTVYFAASSNYRYDRVRWVQNRRSDSTLVRCRWQSYDNCDDAH